MTPGFDDRPDQLSDAPFELAGPTTTEGPTTIPGGPRQPTPTSDDESAPRPETPTDPVLQTTTTTIPPTSPLAPDSSSIQNLCGMTASLASFSTIMENPAVDVATSVAALIRNLDRYVEVSPPSLREQVLYVRDVITDVAGVFSRNGYDRQNPSVRDAVDAATNGQAPYANLVAVTSQIDAFERTAC